MSKHSRKKCRKAMNLREQVFMQILRRELKTSGIESFKDAAEKVNLNQGNAHNAVIRHPTAGNAQSIFNLCGLSYEQLEKMTSKEIAKMLRQKPKAKNTTTEETSCQAT